MAISGPSTPTSPVGPLARVAQGSCGLKSIPSAYLGQVPDHGLHEARVTFAGHHGAELQAQEGVGGQALQGLGQGGGTQDVVGQRQCLQVLGI